MNIDQFTSRLANVHNTSKSHLLIPPTFSITAAGPYPLRQHITLDDGGKGGELLLSFEDVSVTPVTLASVQTGADKRHLKITLQPSVMTGRYTLFCLEGPEVTMDTGGLMGTLPALNEETPPMTVEQYFRFVQLEKERAQLNETANGRLLVGEYNQHNDAYHDVFTNNEQLRKYWQQDGASEEMGDHTSQALKNGAVINPPDNRFGAKGVSYNSNAFAQQLNLWSACFWVYPDAAAAALTFSESVQLTGNTQTATVQFTGEQVHASVNADIQKVNSAESSAKVQALQTALCNIVVNKVATDSDIQICNQHGYVMDLETRQRLQVIYQASLRTQDPKQRVTLSSHSFEIALAQSEFDYVLTEQPDGALTLKLRSTTLCLPQIPLDSDWVADVNTRFIRGLLVDRISSQLSRCLRELSKQES